MADVTPILIKDLAAQTTLADTDYFIVGGADAKKITVAQMKEALGINELNTNLQYPLGGHFELDEITTDNADTPMIYARNGVKINYAQSCKNHPKSGVITIFLTLKVNDLYAAQYAFCGQTIYYRFRDNGSMGAWKVLNS